MKRRMMWGALVDSDVKYGTDKPIKVKTIAVASISNDKRVAGYHGTPVRVLVVS